MAKRIGARVKFEAEPFTAAPRNPTAQHQQAPVALPTLIQRINRVLGKQDERLKKTRSARAHADLGEYYIVNFNRNYVVRADVDPEEFGRELGVLKPWEKAVRIVVTIQTDRGQ